MALQNIETTSLHTAVYVCWSCSLHTSVTAAGHVAACLLYNLVHTAKYDCSHLEGLCLCLAGGFVNKGVKGAHPDFENNFVDDHSHKRSHERPNPKDPVLVECATHHGRPKPSGRVYTANMPHHQSSVILDKIVLAVIGVTELQQQVFAALTYFCISSSKHCKTEVAV